MQAKKNEEDSKSNDSVAIDWKVAWMNKRETEIERNKWWIINRKGMG